MVSAPAKAGKAKPQAAQEKKDDQAVGAQEGAKEGVGGAAEAAKEGSLHSEQAVPVRLESEPLEEPGSPKGAAALEDQKPTAAAKVRVFTA